METKSRNREISYIDEHGVDVEGQNSPIKDVTTYSGLSNADDISIVSDGDSSYALLDTSGIKSEGDIRAEHVKNIKERKRASSSASDYSFLEIPEKSSLDYVELHDGIAGNELQNFKFLSKTEKQDNELSNNNDFISCNMTEDKTGQQSSTLGSSFVVLNGLSMSSSHPSLCEGSIQQPSIHTLPPNQPSNTSISGKMGGKQSMHAGLEEVLVKSEDWKTNKSNSFSKILDIEVNIEESKEDRKIPTSKESPKSMTENTDGQKHTGSASNILVDVQKGTIHNLPETDQSSQLGRNRNIDSNNVGQTSFLENDSSIKNQVEVTSPTRHSGEDSDFSIVEEDGEGPMQIINSFDSDITIYQILGPQSINTDKPVKHSSFADNPKVKIRGRQDMGEDNEVKKDFEDEKPALKQSVKSDIDSDNQSSQYTGPHSPTESCESIELTMSDVVVSDSEDGSHKHSSNDNSDRAGQESYLNIEALDSNDLTSNGFEKGLPKHESFLQIEKPEIDEENKQIDKCRSTLGSQDDVVNGNKKSFSTSTTDNTEKEIEEITKGISSMAVEHTPLQGISETKTNSQKDIALLENKNTSSIVQGSGDTYINVEQSNATSDEMDKLDQPLPRTNYDTPVISDSNEQSSNVFIEEPELKYDPSHAQNTNQSDNGHISVSWSGNDKTSIAGGHISSSWNGNNSTSTAGGHVSPLWIGSDRTSTAGRHVSPLWIGSDRTSTAEKEQELALLEHEDTWEPAEHQSQMEESISKQLKRNHYLTIEINVQCLNTHKSHEADVVTLKEPMINMLVSAKWRYVLNRRKLDQDLNLLFPKTSLQYDESFQKITLLRYQAFVDEEEAQTWSSAVLKYIEKQVQKIDSYVISCLEENSKMVMTKLRSIADDIDITDCMDDSTRKEASIIVTGYCREVASVVIQLGLTAVDTKIFISQEDAIVSCTICNYLLSPAQHHNIVSFDGLRAISSEFTGAHVQFRDDAISLLIKQESKGKVQKFMREKFLKFKAMSKLSLKPMEFTLLCYESVKDFIVKSIDSEIKYCWKFHPEKGDIILFTENQTQLDEIRDIMFSSFTDYKIELNNEFVEHDEDSDIRKTSKWTELVTDIKTKSKGMAVIDINPQQTCITVTGTSDIIKSWQAFGDIKHLVKYIDENIMPVIHPADSCNGKVKTVTKVVSVDPDELILFKEMKLLTKFQVKCEEKNLKLIQTDRGLEVKGKEMSEVNTMCEVIKGTCADLIKPTEKIFLPMGEDRVNDIYRERYKELKELAQNLNIEFEPTNLGFEIRGRSKVNVKQFHNHLEGMVVSNPVMKSFLPMDEKKVTEICDKKHEKLKAFESHLDVKIEATNLGFEVRGEDRSSVMKCCDYLKELQISVDKDITYAREKRERNDLVMPKFAKFIKLDRRVISYIKKYKLIEIKEIMANINVDYRVLENGFEIVGDMEDNITTLYDHIQTLSRRIDSQNINNILQFSDEELQNIEDKFRCLIKILHDRESPEPMDVYEGEAQWNISGVDLCVTVSGVDETSCDILVKPVKPKDGEQRKRITFQDKHGLEEVEILAPVWTEESGKSKHELCELLSELLNELIDTNIIAYPLMMFSGWPTTKLTKVILKTLADFIRDTEHHSLKKVYLYISDKTSCCKVIDAIDGAVPGLKREGLQVSAMGRSALWNVPLDPTEEIQDIHDLDATDVPGHSHPSGADNRGETSKNTHPDTTFKPRSKPRKPSYSDDERRKMLQPDVIVVKGEIAKQEVGAIVNTTSHDFNLKNGAVSKSILTAAGPEIQKEINKKCKGKQLGDIITTHGFKLKCDYVFHGALEKYDKARSPHRQPGIQCMEKFVRSCLEKAQELSLSCLAFPVLGAGALDFPADVVASIILEQVKKFREKYTNIKLSSIRIVVFRDEIMYMIFRKMSEAYRETLMRELESSKEIIGPCPPADVHDNEELSTPEMTGQHQSVKLKPESALGLFSQGISLDIGNINLSAGLGDVTKEKVDGLILLWPADELDLTPADKVTILKSVGKDGLMDWDTGKSTLGESKILVTPGGSLPQKKIIHVYVDEGQILPAFKLALTQADRMKLSSVVIPVRPTDKLAKDVKKFSACIYRAVIEMQNHFHCIKAVQVCIGGKHLCQPILENLAKLQQTGGQCCEVKTGITVEITALKDDMPSVIALLKPVFEEPPSVEEECDEKNTTKDDIKYKLDPPFFLVNATAEVYQDIIETASQLGLVEALKQGLGALCGDIEDHGKTWTLKGSLAQLNACQDYVNEFCSTEVDRKTLSSSTEIKEHVQEPIENSKCKKEITIKVDLTKDMFNAMSFLCKDQLKEIIGNATLNFIDSKSLCVKGQDLPTSLANRLEELIYNFQKTLEIDVLDIPYRQLQGSSTDKFLIKLQIENPGVYVYEGASDGAGTSLQVFLVALSRDEVKSVKQGIIFEHMKPSNRSGRFSHSISENSQSKRSDNTLPRSTSHGNTGTPCKVYQTAEGLIVKVYLASILMVKVDCIVNAANGGLLHGGGIAAVISKAAGPELYKECQHYVKSYGPVKTGDCCVSNAGKLHYKRVIHAVGPQYSSRKSAECSDLLQETVEKCITMANNHHMKSVAIPSISAGLYGMPGELCARCYAVAVMTVSARRKGLWALKEVHFVDNNPDMVFKVQKAFSEYFDNSVNKDQGKVQVPTSVESFKGDSDIIKRLKTAGTWKNVGETLSNKVPILGYAGSPMKKPNVPGHPVRQHELNSTDKEHTSREGSQKQVATSKPSSSPASREKSPLVISKPSDSISYQLPHNTNLPSVWKVTVKLNMINIHVSKKLEVLIFEKNFRDVVTQAIAFSENVDYVKSSLMKEMRKRSSIKDNLNQIKIQLTSPTVGTVVMFEAVTDIYVQKVFVVFAPKFQKNGSQNYMKEFHDRLFSCYLRLFHEVTTNSDIEFLAVSFLRTGNKGTSFEDGANVFFHAVNTFSVDIKPTCKLKQIHLVVNKDTNALKVIKSVLEQNYGRSGQWMEINEKVDKSCFAQIGIRTIEERKRQNHDVKPDLKGTARQDVADDSNEHALVVCAICLDPVQRENRCQLEICKHVFCKDCITECFRHKPVCPTCNTVYGVVKGNQPNGTMKIDHNPHIQLPGFRKHGEWCITYSFPSGTQTSDHTHPGKVYRGTTRTAYLPDNNKGTLVKDLLKVAFDRKLVFTIGHSRTTGEENVVTWNDIHHKTSRAGGPQGFGYPDPEYLDRVLEELASKGVTEYDLKK